MDFLTYLCAIVCSMNIVHSNIIIPPELRSHYATSGMEWEDFIEQIMFSLNVGATDIEIEEQEPGEPPEPTLSPSFLNPNSSLMSGLKNGSLGVSLLDLAEIEELPPTPEPAPITPAPPTLAPITVAPLPLARFTQIPAGSARSAQRAAVSAIPSTIQVLGSNPIPAQTQIRDVEAKVPLSHGVLTLHYHSFIENSNTARSSSLTGQPPLDIFAPSSGTAQPNNVTVGNQTSVTPVNRSNPASIDQTEIPPPANPVQVQVGRLSQIGTLLNPTESPLPLNPVQVQVGRLSPIGTSINPTERPLPLNPVQVQVGRLGQIGTSLNPTERTPTPNPIQVQVGRLGQIGTSIIPTERPLSPNPIQVQVGRLIGTSITPTDRPLSPNPVQVLVGRLSQLGLSIIPTESPLPPKAAQVQVGRLGQIGTSLNPTERPPTPNPVQIQVGRLSQIGTTRILQPPTAAPELGPGTGRNIGQASGSAQSQANSQAPLYHGILTLHYQSYLPLNSSQQSNDSLVGAAATDGFSSGVSSLLRNTQAGNGGPSVSGKGTVSLTDPLSPLSSTGPGNGRAPTTSQSSGTLGGLSSLISTMITRNRVPASRRTNRIRLNPAVDSAVSRTPVMSSSQQTNSSVQASNVSSASASQTATAGVLISNTSAPLSQQSNLASTNLGSNLNFQNFSAIQFNSTEGIVSPVSLQPNQSQAIPTRANNATETPMATSIVENLSPVTSGQNIEQANVSSSNTSASEDIALAGSTVSQSPVQTNSSTATSTRISAVTMNSSNTNETVAEVGFSAQPISLEIFNGSQPTYIAPSRNGSAVPLNINVTPINSSSVIANATETESPFPSNGQIQNANNATEGSTPRSTDQATNWTRFGNFQTDNPPGNQTIVGQSAAGVLDTFLQNSTGTLDPLSQNSTFASEIPSPNMANVSIIPSENATGISNPIQNIAQTVSFPSNNMTENSLPGNVELSTRSASTALDIAPRSQNSTADSRNRSSSSTGGSSTSTGNGSIVSDVLPQNSTGDVELSQGNPRGVVQIPTIPRTASGVLLAGSGAAFRERPATSKSEMHLPGWKWSMESGAPSRIPVNVVKILLLALTSILFLFH